MSIYEFALGGLGQEVEAGRGSADSAERQVAEDALPGPVGLEIVNGQNNPNPANSGSEEIQQHHHGADQRLGSPVTR